MLILFQYSRFLEISRGLSGIASDSAAQVMLPSHAYLATSALPPPSSLRLFKESRPSLVSSGFVIYYRVGVTVRKANVAYRTVWSRERASHQGCVTLPPIEARRHSDYRMMSSTDSTIKVGTTLFDAARRGKKEMIFRMVKQGYNVNEKHDKIGKTALHVACRHGHAGTVQYLLQLGACAEERDTETRTPMHLSALFGHALTCSLLARWKADVNAQDVQGCTPLHLAAVYGHGGACGLLLDHNAEINATDANGRTSLRVASQYGQKSVVILLVERKAELNIKDHRGATALRASVQYGHDGINFN
jgi:hypothetical protein